MNKTLPVFLAFLMIILSISTISAHDFWLVPQKFRINPGDSLTIFANIGMGFPNSLSAVTPDRVNQFMLLGKSIKNNFTDLKVQGNSLVTECTFKEPGNLCCWCRFEAQRD